MKSGKLQGSTRLAIVLALGGLLALVGATPASAAPVNITLTLTQGGSLEYGQGWSVEGDLANPIGCSTTTHCPPDLIVTIDGYTKDLGNDYVSGSTFYVSDLDFQGSKFIGAGTHTLSAKLVEGTTVDAASTTPLSFTLTKASVTATTTIVPDPNNSNNAIVTSKLTGNYIDQLPNCYCEDAGNYDLPAGSWKLTISDAAGNTVFSKQEDEKAGGFPVFVNYWQSVPAGKSFSAQSTFTVTDASASSFTMSTQKFPWTSAGGSGSGSGVSPTSTPKPIPAKAASFEPPLLVFYAALLIAVILLAIDILLFVRRRRAKSQTTGASA